MPRKLEQFATPHVAYTIASRPMGSKTNWFDLRSTSMRTCARPLLLNDRAAGSRRFRRRRMQVAAGEFDECGPIGSWSVAAGVLAEGEVAGDERGFNGRKDRRP